MALERPASQRAPIRRRATLVSTPAFRTIAGTLAILLTAPGAPAPAQGAPSLIPDVAKLQYAPKRTDLRPGVKERIETIVTDDNIDYVTKTYVIARGNAAEMYQIIQNAVALEGGHVDRVAPGVEIGIGDDAAIFEARNTGESFLIVTAPDWMFPGLDETVRLLDRPDAMASADGTAARFVRMKHRPPSHVAQFLEATAASGLGAIVADDDNNLLYLEDAPSDFGALMEALPYADAPQATASVEVRIVELLEEHSRNVGLYWDAWKSALPAEAAADLFFGRLSGPDGMERIRDVTAFFNALSPHAAASFINYLVGDGKAEAVSQPRLTLVQGQESVIAAVTRHLYRALEKDESGARAFVDKEAEEGVTLTIRPFIGAETLTLEVEAIVSNLAGFSPEGLPILSTNSLVSRAVLTGDEPLVMAGLKRGLTVERKDKVAILGSIPVLGRPFRRTMAVRREADVLIALTPRGRHAP